MESIEPTLFFILIVLLMIYFRVKDIVQTLIEIRDEIESTRIEKNENNNTPLL